VVVLRDGWAQDASVLVMDAGPHGAMNCGHAHADALSLALTVDGSPLFVDPGTFVYTTNAATRDAFRATASHTAVTVDGASSSEMAGAFSWHRKATTRVTHWRSGRLGDCVVASHDGFDDRGSRPFACQRIVLRLPMGGTTAWVVLDRFHAAREVELAAHYQCAPSIAVLAQADGRVQFRREGADVADMLAFGGTASETRGLVSATYGTSEPAPHLAIVRRGSGALTLCSVLVGPGVAAPTYREDQGALSLVIPNGSTELVVLCGEGATARLGNFALDGVALWGEREVGSGALLWWEAVGARRVAIGPSVILDSNTARDTGWIAGSAPLNSN
ncbi:MAG: heparinase II/III-family protein, partial [Cytophagaceae bacterium]|nr:heparinase II/III-family protein [Gemmatimonadaceae bacterium]